MLIYTLGYAGFRVTDRFLLAIPDHTLVVDVRKSPYCRWNPDYCADRLKQLVPHYYSVPALGNLSGTPHWQPPDQRVVPAVFQHLRAALARTGLPHVLFLCMEAHPEACHRTEVAHYAKSDYFPQAEIQHLG